MYLSAAGNMCVSVGHTEFLIVKSVAQLAWTSNIMKNGENVIIFMYLIFRGLGWEYN